MKLPLSQAARSLGIHPTNLLLYMSELGVQFEDVWPELDSTWLDAVRGQDRTKFARPSRPTVPKAEAAQAQLPPVAEGLSDGASHILEKMWRQGKWGDLSLSLDTVKKHYAPPNCEPHEAIRELIDIGLVVSTGRAGPFSLNSSRKGDIEKIATTLLTRSRR